MAEPTLRRGEEETRTDFERAQDNFNDATGDARIQTSTAPCPTCDAPMLLEKTYKGADAYHFTGSCSVDADHDIERFGYFSTTEATI